jgi:hypothetical protein
MGEVALVLEGGWPTLARDLHSSFHNSRHSAFGECKRKL